MDCGAAGRWPFGAGAAVPVAPARKCRVLFAEGVPGPLAAAAPTSLSAAHICGNPDCGVPPADRARGSDSFRGPEFSRRARRNVNVASAGGICPVWTVFQDHELSGIHQYFGGRVVSQGGPLDEFSSAAALRSHCVAGDRASAPEGQRLSALAPLPRGLATGTEPREVSCDEGRLISISELWRITTHFGLDSRIEGRAIRQNVERNFVRRCA